ncbi:MAG: S9 family peptidase, partial [Psychrobium sp.]
MNKNRLFKRLALTLGLGVALGGCQTTNDTPTTQATTAKPLTLEQIYKDGEFRSEWIGRIRWLADGTGYTAVEKSSYKMKNDKGEMK